MSRKIAVFVLLLVFCAAAGGEERYYFGFSVVAQMQQGEATGMRNWFDTQVRLARATGLRVGGVRWHTGSGINRGEGYFLSVGFWFLNNTTLETAQPVYERLLEAFQQERVNSATVTLICAPKIPETVTRQQKQ